MREEREGEQGGRRGVYLGRRRDAASPAGGDAGATMIRPSISHVSPGIGCCAVAGPTTSHSRGSGTTRFERIA
jgi:hypothetical protein